MSEVLPILLTFLEELKVQRVKGVQALPGVWGLLKHTKKAEAEEEKT